MGSSIAGNHTTNNYLALSCISIYVAWQSNSTTTRVIIPLPASGAVLHDAPGPKFV